MHDLQIREDATPGRGKAILGILAGAAAGATAMFMFDPQQGRRRRALARDKVIHVRNVIDQTLTEELPKRIEYASGFAEGAKHRLHTVIEDSDRRPENEHVLIDRVQSTVFRDADVPKGNINIDAAGTTVYLRGSVEDDGMREEIEERVRRVEGVDDVINLINQPEADSSSIR
jgi:gas vesicle protein